VSGLAAFVAKAPIAAMTTFGTVAVPNIWLNCSGERLFPLHVTAALTLGGDIAFRKGALKTDRSFSLSYRLRAMPASSASRSLPVMT
jgi:hypothetical protein